MRGGSAPGGVPVFLERRSGAHAEEVLAAAGLKAGPAERYEDGVKRVAWTRRG